MKIERVNEETFPQAAAVYEISWRESHRDICSPAFLERRDCAGYLRQRLDGLYMISDGEPVGVFCLRGGEIGDLYIHPDQAGKGYGTACMRFAMAGSRQLRLTVLSSNDNAVGLYKKLGFRFTGNDLQLRDDLWEREMIYTENENG